jgi:hypothetical protein
MRLEYIIKTYLTHSLAKKAVSTERMCKVKIKV